jgi:hypothetical protein
MARKKDVDFAIRGEAKQDEEKVYLPQSGDVTALNDLESDESPNVIFKLVKTDRKGGIYIHGEDEVIDPKTGRLAKVRLISGVDTIWAKDQKDVTKEQIERNMRSLHFPRGQKILVIPKYDRTALEYARVTRHNIGAPNRKSGSKYEFFEYNPKKQAELALQEEMFQIEMITKAQGQEPEFMKKHAAYLGLKLVDDFGLPKNPDAIKRDYIVFAKRNPQRFYETLESKEIEVSYMIRKALSEQMIDLGSRNGMAVWAANGATICRLPPMADPLKHLTDLAFTNSNEGRDFLQGLQSIA